jgi:hypothetical protein
MEKTMDSIERNARWLREADGWHPTDPRQNWDTAQATYRIRAERLAAAGLTLARIEPDDATIDAMAAVYLAREAAIEETNALNIIRDYKAAQHSGDCTKEPWTCMRCQVDEAIEIARAAYPAAVKGCE